MRRTWIALIAGVLLPAILLGCGWLFASFRERDTRIREQRAVVMRTADAVRAAIDEGLEELRRREDARPFYHYNHLYNPPEVLALEDPVAVSPLASAPDDPRIVGYFQINPDGTTQTPHANDEGAGSSVSVPGADVALARRIKILSSEEPFDALRALVHGGPDQTAGNLVAARRDVPALTPEAAPVTVTLNRYSQQAYEDLSQAQQGVSSAGERALSRGRQAPLTNRRDVPWESVRENPSNAGILKILRREVVRSPPPPRLPVARSQLEVEVDYTPMTYGRMGDQMVLHRLVSHREASVVQGLILDREHLVREWIPSVVRRHVVTGVEPSIVPTTDSARACALRTKASDVLGDSDLCFSVATPSASIEAMNAELFYQGGALLILLAVVALAIVLTVRAGRRAEALSRQKSAFVSAVSHELRTPLTTIRMHAEMLEAGLVSEGKKAQFHEDLVNESARLSRLVDNVLELSRFEEGRRTMRLVRTDLRAAVVDVVRGQERTLLAKGFVLHVNPGEPVNTDVDVQALSQIVCNLIDNAVKYAREPGPAQIEIDVGVTEGSAVLRVLDRGPGIPDADKKRVFERFYRVDRPSHAHMPGTGIGLSLVRDLARAHGGDARIQDREGGGTEVRVTLGRALG